MATPRLRQWTSGAALAAVLAAAAPAAAQPAAEDPVVAELQRRRDENLLLHRRVDLRGVRQYKDGRFAPQPPALGTLLIVHIWAVECKPCVEEFPVLRRIAKSLHTSPQVKVVLITETTDAAKLSAFWSSHQDEIPRVDHYQSTDERLRASLQNSAQPTTLLLDQRGLVRQAFVGSLNQRRSELADAIARLLRVL